MNNVHGFNDISPGSGDQFRRSDRRQPNNNRPERDNGFAGENGMDNWNFTIDHLKAVEEHKVLFISGNTKIKNPRHQNYFDMLKLTCCPVLKLFSITWLILLAIIAMYIVQIVKGIDKQQSLLQIQGIVLYDLGANFSPAVKTGQVYRLLAAQFLHVNFIHLIGNILTVIIFVSRVEYTYGWWKTLLIYLISGIGGNIFSDLVSPSDTIVKAGASTCLFGIIGTIIGYVIINWKGLDKIGRMFKCQLVFIAIIIVMFIFVLTPYSGNIDYMGHLGGFLTGITLSTIHSTIRNQKREKVMRIVGFLLFIGLFLLWFLLFYLKN